jgi:hypothetical protein
LKVVQHNQVRGLARCVGQRAEERPCAKPKLPESGTALGERRQLAAGVIATGLGVLAHVPTPEESCEEPVHGADVEPGPGRDRCDRDLAIGRYESLQQVQRAVDRLNRAATSPRGDGWFFHRAEASLCMVEA